MNYEIKDNPDGIFVRNRKKAIKKNNGFCIGCPHTDEYKCPCKGFREMDHDGWCADGLYYKQFVEEDN